MMPLINVILNHLRMLQIDAVSVIENNISELFYKTIMFVFTQICYNKLF